jgi:hypothetical protein
MRSSSTLLALLAAAAAGARAHDDGPRPDQEFVQDDVEELQRKWGFEVGFIFGFLLPCECRAMGS